MGNELIEFHARFSGKSHKIEVPVANVLAIYARENGQGMAFPVEAPAQGDEGPVLSSEEGHADDDASDATAVPGDAETQAALPTPDAADEGAKGGGKGHLKVVK
jgi:stringent starvation protein B